MSTDAGHNGSITLGDATTINTLPQGTINGNHATTLVMHLAGKPVMQIPVFLEQELNARATVRLGAGLLVQPSDGMAIQETVSKLLCDTTLAESARRFAVKQTGFSAQAEIAAVVARLQGLVH